MNSTASQSIWALSHHSPSDTVGHVQSLYNLMNGTFALPDYFGSGARIVGVYLTNTTDDLPYAEYREAGNSSDISGLDKRYTETITGHTCTNPPHFANRLVTYEQQKFIAGKLCTWVSKVSPYAYGVVAVKITNLMCGEGGTFTCNAFYSIAHTAAGSYIGPGIQAMCAESYSSLIAACDEKGGVMDVKIDQTDAIFQVEGYANSEEDDSCSSTSTSLCATYTCHGNCNPGGGTP
ncbi:uncharacterized protein N7482_003687 [Penicillium canariense]|uniref:Uncharacterized protein n=1 Tax=Penicillium canariense TaxID=189055 RepID=A0A9W9I769_9EURO|nr:uncharacterized protein N7482_003687 [Penicillium canariense]KAJ5168093.1 hypothetical protein N7482_003687 [Penicillium canariense]